MDNTLGGMGPGSARKPFFLVRWWRGFLEQFKAGAREPLRKRDKVVGVLLIVLFVFVFYIVLDANKYPALVRVVAGEGKVGINPTSAALDFGDLSRGTSAVKRVALANGTFMPMYIIVWRTGGLSDLMQVDRNFFTLAPGESTKLEFTTYIPASAEIGANYTGRVYLFKIPTFGL